MSSSKIFWRGSIALAPRSASVAFKIFQARSTATSSLSESGPTGMPVGPLSLNDEVAVDLAWKILKATEADLGAAAVDPRQKMLLEELVEKRGRFGRKNGKGFYDYPPNAPKKLWPGLAELQKKKLDPEKIDVEELKLRLLGMQALETARCFEEKVLTDVREADVGSILGFGFAPFSGGTLSYICLLYTSPSPRD